MRRDQTTFLFLNIGHFLDHLFMLIFASAAALALTVEWNMRYAELIPYATPGFVAFGVCALFAGWIADKWSREAMMAIFFIGTGLGSLLASLATGPWQISACLLLVGVFAAIYHPVGLAMVVQGRARTGMPLAINGVFGNLGVACAALMTGLLIDTAGWRSAFAVPGAVSVVLGALFLFFIRGDRHGRARLAGDAAAGRKNETASLSRGELARVFGIVFFTTALGGLIFQSTTFSLPEVFDEQLAGSATRTGWYAFVVFSIAALAQLAVGRLVDRYSLRVVFAVVALLQAILLFCMTRVSGAASVAVATAFMLVVFGQIPINDVLVSRVARSEWHSRAYAARYVVTFSVMASAVPLIAWIHGAWGFSRLFALLAVAASLIFVSVLLLPDTRALRRPAASAAPGGRRPPASTR